MDAAFLKGRAWRQKMARLLEKADQVSSSGKASVGN
mgnify:CR=1 FL=1